MGVSRGPAIRPADLLKLLRIVLRLGVLSPRRGHFWRLAAKALRRPHTLKRAGALSGQGEHFIRYTKEEVLPRIASAPAQGARQRARARRWGVPGGRGGRGGGGVFFGGAGPGGRGRPRPAGPPNCERRAPRGSIRPPPRATFSPASTSSGWE